MSVKNNDDQIAEKKETRNFQAKTSKGEATRRRLMEAAEEVFGIKGFYNTSIVDITQKAQVAMGTFYVYFPSKMEIFEELVKELSHNLRKEISQAVAGSTTRQEVEEKGFVAFFTYIKKHHNLYRIVHEAEFVDEKLYKWYYQRLAKGYINGLQAAIDDKEFRTLDVDTLAYCLMGIADMLGKRWVMWEQKDVPIQVIKTVLALILEGLIPRS